LSHPLFNPAFEMRSRWAIKKSEGTCLEVGCNLGFLTYRFSLRKRVVSGDINPSLVKNVKKFCSNKDDLDLVVFDVYNLPFQKCFDTVLLIDVLEHLADPVKALQEVARVSTKKILIDVPNNDFAAFMYPNLIPEHFKEPSHIQKTNFTLLKSWLNNISYKKMHVHGSYIPMPLPFIGASYFLEYFFNLFGVRPKRIHFQISCELILR
jgi:SAM-dependent methyltransferase